MVKGKICKQVAKDRYGLNEEEVMSLPFSIKKHKIYYSNIYLFDYNIVREFAKDKFRCKSYKELNEIIGNKESLTNKIEDLRQLKKSIIEEIKNASKERERLKKFHLKQHNKISRTKNPFQR